MIDTYRHKGMRKNMLDELRQKGIKNKKVLEAMHKVPRHWFLDQAFLEIAYDQKKEVKKILVENGFYINKTVKDLAKNDRCIISTKI